MARVAAAGAGEYLVEPMVVVAEKTGNYIITTRFLSSDTYRITSSLPHTVTEKDKNMLPRESFSLKSGNRLNQENRFGVYAKSSSRERQSIVIWTTKKVSH